MGRRSRRKGRKGRKKGYNKSRVTAKKAMNLAVANRKILRSDLKHISYDFSGTVTAGTTESFGISLLYPGNGTLNTLRVGDTIRATTIKLRGQYFVSVDTQKVRFICYVDKRPDQTSTATASAKWEDLLKSEDGASLWKFHRQGMFKVLWDKSYSATVVEMNELRTFSASIKVNRRISFSANTAAAIDINKNAIKMICVMYSGSGLTSVGGFAVNMRAYYIDV